MFALIDCNSFFCSVEKAFHAGLSGKPVCVLSSNDGCIVALTKEAKAVGLHRGDPLFRVRDIVDRCGVTVFSGNMYLYAAMPKRIVSIIRSAVSKVENYSIDESFCDLSGYERHYDLTEYMRGLADRIRLWTDIPVSVGIAPTKTLAKMGSKFAKEYRGYRSVCSIDCEKKRRKALEIFPLDDVCGIGRRTYEKLQCYGVNTPLDFADKSLQWVRSRFTLPVQNVWHELNGRPKIDTSEILRHQTICTSRSFGEMITDLDSLTCSTASFAASCANKLRAQGSVAGAVSAFVCSNRFREDLEQYSNIGTFRFHTPTADTIEITEAVTGIVTSLFREGIRYKKSGVILHDIRNAEHIEQDIFDTVRNRPERQRLSETVDRMNVKFGLKSVRLASEGDRCSRWRVKSEHRSPNYLTDIDEILTIDI